MERLSLELFGDRKYGLFWAKYLMERWYLMINENFLFWTFPLWYIWSFFSQKVDEKTIFNCFFLALHDILGLRKYGFLCGETCTMTVYNFHLPELNPNKAKVLVYFKYCSLFWLWCFCGSWENLRTHFVEWCCALVITTIQQCH